MIRIGHDYLDQYLSSIPIESRAALATACLPHRKRAAGRCRSVIRDLLILAGVQSMDPASSGVSSRRYAEARPRKLPMLDGW